MVKNIEVDFNFKDDRGEIIQLVHEGYNQVNVITSKKGVYRGGHLHKENTEAFYIITGQIELIVNEEAYFFNAGDFFSIEAFDMHSFRFLEDTLLVSMYSKGVELENGRKDIYTKEEL